MAKIIGRFYFKKTTTGNLLGEYSNNKMVRVETESANLKEDTPTEEWGNFVGTYDSVWHDGSPHHAELTIAHKQGSRDRLFTLIWTEDGTRTYKGEGMLVDGMLIGDYQSV